MQTNDYLMHWGIRGMKWGIRKYQNPDGTLTAEGKLRYSADGRRLTKAERKKAKQKAEQLAAARKKAAKKRAEKKEYEEGKKKALEKGKASDILKYQGDLTHEQIQKALTRLNDERQLKEIASKEVSAGKARVNRALATLDTIGDAARRTKIAADNIKSAIDFINGLNKDSNNAHLDKISEHGTAEQVAKNAYKLNANQIATAKKRLDNIESVNNRARTDRENKKKIEEGRKAVKEARKKLREAEKKQKEENKQEKKQEKDNNAYDQLKSISNIKDVNGHSLASYPDLKYRYKVNKATIKKKKYVFD